MSAQSYFISGSNRGIGLELVKLIASRPNTVVFAGVRNPAKAGELRKFADRYSNVHIIKLDSASATDAQAAARSVEEITGGLDVVIANAGIAENWKRSSKSTHNHCTSISKSTLSVHWSSSKHSIQSS